MAHLNLEVMVAEYDKIEAEKKGFVGASLADIKWNGPLSKGDYFIVTSSCVKLEVRSITHWPAALAPFNADFTEVRFEAPLEVVERLLALADKWEPIDL